MRSAPICYIDHETGDSDHMNAHIQTESCKRRPGMSEQRIEKLLSDLRELEEDAESNNLRTYDSETWTAWAADVARRAIDALSASPAETGNIGELLQSIGARTSERDQARDCIKILEQRIHELEAAERRTSTYAICENHAPDRWEGDGTCIVCEAQRLWDELTALKKASETSGTVFALFSNTECGECCGSEFVGLYANWDLVTAAAKAEAKSRRWQATKNWIQDRDKLDRWYGNNLAIHRLPLPAPPPSASSATTEQT